ncbi:MAG: serine/threonine protein kinase [Spirochaetales bacterium]|nr:serine/threonine protein kinase [Spirochaetales bacterium]
MTDKKLIGKYRIVEKIGEGGMGKIYKAVHPTLKRHIIIKQLSVRSKASVNERFKREAEIMIDLRNENIVQVYDYFREGSTYYIAMEYINGISLEKLVETKKRICPVAALLIFNEICKGMKYAHDKGIVHRDIKPDNILISRDGEVKIVDFGIAKDIDVDDDLTKTGALLGTPSYMSPEQLSSAKQVDKRSDIYSLGVLFYKMITGTRPFAGNFTVETMNDIVKGNYTKPEKVNPEIPGVFKILIRKTMHCRVNKRYKDLKYPLHLISKYLYKFKDQKQTEKAIEEYIMEKDNEHSRLASLPLKKKRHIVSKLVLGFLVLGILALCGLFIYNRGYYNEITGARTHGSLEVKVAVPADYYKPLNNVYAKLAINPVSAEKKETTEFILSPPLTEYFQWLPWLPEKKNRMVFFSTEVFYLPAGPYHLVLYLEDQVIVREFYLYPRTVQMTNLDTKLRKVLEFRLSQPLKRDVTVQHRVLDDTTEKDITAGTKIMVRAGNKWLDWDKDKKKIEPLLVSGSVFTIKYDAEDYYPRTLRFVVPKNNDMAVINVDLSRIAGRLILDSDTAGLEILFDNKVEDYMGGHDKQFVSYGTTIQGKKEFLLPAGIHKLTVKKDNRSRDHSLTVTKDKVLTVTVKYNNNTKLLQIE